MDRDYLIAPISLADRPGMDALSRDHRLAEGGNIFLINIAYPDLYGPANQLALKWAMDQNAGLIINGGFENDPDNNHLLFEMMEYARRNGRYDFEVTRNCLTGGLYDNFYNTSILVLRPKSRPQ